MLSLLVAVVLVAAKDSLAATLGVGLVPPGSAIGRRAVGVGVVPGSTVVSTGGGVVAAGSPVVGSGVGVPGSPTLIRPDRLPAIPQYARTFGSFSGSLSGYIRDQWETRDDSFVRGGYTMVDADGSLVVVEYSSDPISGFRVVVKRSGLPDYFLDSIVLGGPLPGGYLPPFYSDFGYDYSDDYYGYDYDYYYDGLDYDLDFFPIYYSDLDYDLYAPSFVDTYDIEDDIDLELLRRRRSAPQHRAASTHPRRGGQ